MTSGDKPQYVSQSDLARRFDVSRTAVANWIARWPCIHEVLPTPEPDAFVEGRPLWLRESLPKWDAWREQHMRRWGNHMEHPRPTRRKVQVPEKIVLGVTHAEAAENQEALWRLLRELHARAGWPMPSDLAARTGVCAETIRKALKNTTTLPERETVISLTVALGGDPDVAADLWMRSRASRMIDGGWLSRVLSVVHGKVLQLAAGGATAESTATTMGWTVEGVRAYWDDITERLRVESMEQAVEIALESGYLQDIDGAILLTPRRQGRAKQGGEHGYLVNKIAHEMRAKIADAEPGSHLGTIEQLRAEFKTSATTITYAVKILKAEGVIAGGGKGHPLIVAER